MTNMHDATNTSIAFLLLSFRCTFIECVPFFSHSAACFRVSVQIPGFSLAFLLSFKIFFCWFFLLEEFAFNLFHASDSFFSFDENVCASYMKYGSHELHECEPLTFESILGSVCRENRSSESI